MEHDTSYKLLFSHARMVEDLLRGFVHEAWVREVDFTTLERVTEAQVSDALDRRAAGALTGAFTRYRNPSCL
jgi:hypothetical protein